MNLYRVFFLGLAVFGLFLLFGTSATSTTTMDKKPNPVLVPVDTSAPDLWGYTWIRSTSPGGPTFGWVDITTRGTLVTGLTDDNSAGPFPIGFAFPYYWYEVTQFRVGSNGYITFGNQTANYAPTFVPVPNTSPPNDMLVALGGDLVFSGQAGATGTCYYWSNGIDSLVVSFLDVTEWESTINPNSKHTFQIILLKQDSSIIYQYGAQQGSFNSTNNATLSIGIENATGQIGLNYGFSSTPPHPFMPTNGLAVRIKRTTNTGLQITDVGVVGGFNSDNLAKIVRVNQPDTIRVLVRNYGTAPLTNVRVRYAITRALQPTALDTVFIPSLAPSQSVTITFPRLFTPAVTGSYSALFNAFVSGDQGPGNDSKIAEVLSASFGTGVSTRLAFEAGTSGGSINWIGGGGMGVKFDLPVYPVKVETVSVNITSITAAALLVEIMDGSTGVPGTILGSKNVSATVGDNRISFALDSVVINNGPFFVGARGQMAFTYEQSPPISFRTWEYTGGWASYRLRDVQDIMIRVTVRQLPPVSVPPGGQSIPESFALGQNYPNPFNPSTKISFALPKDSEVELRVFDLLGREVATLVNGMVKVGQHEVEWQATGMPSGVYFYRLTTDGFSQSKKLLLLK